MFCTTSRWPSQSMPRTSLANHKTISLDQHADLPNSKFECTGIVSRTLFDCQFIVMSLGKRISEALAAIQRRRAIGPNHQ